jgi:hypothetical protein
MLASSTIATRAFKDCSPDGNPMFIWLVVPRNVGDRNLFRRERIAPDGSDCLLVERIRKPQQHTQGIPASNIPTATPEPSEKY